MTPTVVITVDVTPGVRLLNGDPAGVGTETKYGIALTTNGIDRQPVAGAEFKDQKEAIRYATALERSLEERFDP